MSDRVYIIVEGLRDVKYLNILLGPYLGDRYQLLFYPTQGFNFMLSSIRPVIDQAMPGSKILFVFDADTIYLQKAKERLDFVKDQIGYVRNGCKVGAFYFLPEIEEFLMGEDAGFRSRKRTPPEIIIEYIETHRENLLKKPPLSDMIAFIEDDAQNQNPV